jgi:hypothetical protein
MRPSARLNGWLSHTKRGRWPGRAMNVKSAVFEDESVRSVVVVYLSKRDFSLCSLIRPLEAEIPGGPTADAHTSAANAACVR